MYGHRNILKDMVEIGLKYLVPPISNVSKLYLKISCNQNFFSNIIC